jgi:uncharacterized protein YjbJ (UPF0337 family)
MSEKPKGKAREVYGAFIGDEAKKEEGRALRRKTEAQEESEQREKTAQAKAEAKQAQKERDRQRLKGEGVLGGQTGKKGGWVVSPITSQAASGRR